MDSLNVQNAKTRVEKDALGEVSVPLEALYGSFTVRALENFNLSGLTPSSFFRRAICLLKKSACEANTELGLIPEDKSKAMLTAMTEFLNGDYDDQYHLDYFQAGAGTPLNMNFNEIVANRANELLGGKLGVYDLVHPNNHVNMAQSSNDVIPTAIRIACVLYFREELLPAMQKLIDSIYKKGLEGAGVLKVGRTHLEDAVPMTVEQEFSAWARSLEKSLSFARKTLIELFELGIGGTALGSGITTHPEYTNVLIKYLRKNSGVEEFFISDNLFEMCQSSAALGEYSAGLRAIANDLNKISNDLKLLNMGPKAGIAEIILPEVEPGSSIMPGKVNPSVAEAIHMVACQIVGNDAAVQMGVSAGQLQLNVMTPMILFNLEFSASLLKRTADMMRVYCVDEIIIDKKMIKKHLDNSLVFATALVPYLGYQVVAELVNEGLKESMSIKDVALKYQLLTQNEVDFILDPVNICAPALIDVELRETAQNRAAYKEYRVIIGK